MMAEKFIETITTSILYLKFKENSQNDKAAHGICFDFLLKFIYSEKATKFCEIFT